MSRLKRLKRIEIDSDESDEEVTPVSIKIKRVRIPLDLIKRMEPLSWQEPLRNPYYIFHERPERLERPKETPPVLSEYEDEESDCDADWSDS